TGGTNTGSTDTGGTNTGSTDTGGTDTGSTDNGGTDTGSTDTGGTDTGSTDNGGTDTGSTDTGGTDTGSTDTGGTSTGTTDTGGTTTGTTGGTTTGTTTGTTGGTTGGTTSGGPSTTTGGSTTPPSGQVWPSVGAVLASGQLQGGDRIFLMDGYHGAISFQGMRFSTPIVVAPVAGEVAHVDSILIRGSSNIVFQGLKVWATSANAGTGPLIRSYGDTSDLAFTDLDVRGVSSSANYMQWAQTDWQNYKRDGLMIDGDSVTIARNRLTGIFHGIKSVASNTLMEENIIDGFAGDGMRANGDNSIVRKNKVQNCFAISANHMDGFQSFSTGSGGKVGTGTVKNLTVEDNKIFEWTSTSTNPLRCKLQGISMFDGMYDGIVIRNNVISTRAYHGISINGAINTLVVNNTVVDANGANAKWPWIRLSPHKNGTPSQNTTFANNLVNGNKVTADTSRNIVSANNVIVINAASEFSSVAQQDFSLKSTAKAANAGLAKYAPQLDIIGTARPLGKAPDAGAYENF
ncbi:MAG: choice-of-anchor Q domain-containing protein, partial [Albidovulum sp.]|uniref:choice-of-anchor Q domain-containing protein n=1 Tax=Albidovulum sp. TaxID=1872424 RepID=UPI003CA36B25